MPNDKSTKRPSKPAQNPPKPDLRRGMRGSLTQPTPPIAGGEALYGLEETPLASPEVSTPAGHGVHE